MHNHDFLTRVNDIGTTGASSDTIARMDKNHLYFGDNLEVLRKYIKDESVDL